MTYDKLRARHPDEMHVNVHERAIAAKKQGTAFSSGLPGGVLGILVARRSGTMFKCDGDGGVQVSDYLVDFTCLRSNP